MGLWNRPDNSLFNRTDWNLYNIEDVSCCLERILSGVLLLRKKVLAAINLSYNSFAIL